MPNNSRRPRSIEWCRQAAPRGRGKALPSPGRPGGDTPARPGLLQTGRLESAPGLQACLREEPGFPSVQLCRQPLKEVFSGTAHTQDASSPSRGVNKRVPPLPTRRGGGGSAGGWGQVARAAGQPLNAPEAPPPHPTGFSFRISRCFDQGWKPQLALPQPGHSSGQMGSTSRNPQLRCSVHCTKNLHPAQEGRVSDCPVWLGRVDLYQREPKGHVGIGRKKSSFLGRL